MHGQLTCVDASGKTRLGQWRVWQANDNTIVEISTGACLQYSWLKTDPQSIEAYEQEALRIFQQMIGIQRDVVCL